MKEFIKINECDNVIIALRDYKKDEVIDLEGEKITLLEDINRGHKIAIKNINKGENVVKYGLPIGYALEDIKVGSWVHTHNTKTNLKDLNTYSYTPKFTDRNIRKDINNNLRRLQKAEELTDDELKSAEEEVQKLTDKAIKDIDSLLALKEKEITTV